MDDYLESSPTVEEAARKAQDLVKLLTLGGFTLTKFVSNAPSVLTQLEPNRESPEKQLKTLPTSEGSSHVLGLKWNHEFDTLVVSRGTSPDVNQAITQRVVLSLVSAVFDPIGLVAPFTVKARLLLKEIWRLSGQQWDDDLPEEIVTKFVDWSRELPLLNDIVIPRSYFQNKTISLELHMFGDSSQDVFSAVAFLRGKTVADGRTSTVISICFWQITSRTDESANNSQVGTASRFVSRSIEKRSSSGTHSDPQPHFYVDRQYNSTFNGCALLTNSPFLSLTAWLKFLN